MPDAVICPDCNGAKTVTGLAKFSGGRPCAPMTFACFRCRGAGTVPDIVATWIEEGRQLRARRIERDRSVREEAHALGVRVVDLADAEHGRRDPAPYLAMNRRA